MLPPGVDLPATPPPPPAARFARVDLLPCPPPAPEPAGVAKAAETATLTPAASAYDMAGAEQ